MMLAHANNIVHHDIKPGNIVTQQLPDGKFQTRLIDYDFAFDMTHITPNNLRHLNNQYIFFPFESLFVNKATDDYFFPKARMPTAYLTQLEIQLRQLIGSWYGQFSFDYIKGFVIGDKQAFSMTRHQQIGFTEYTHTYKPTLSVLRTNPRHYLKSVDVYMLGYTLGLVLNKFLSCIMVCENKAARRFRIAFKADTPHKKGYLFSNEFVASGFSQEAENWFKILEEYVLIPYADLVEEMTTWDLTKRITMDEAHMKYGRLLITMGLSFTEDAITRFLVPLGTVKIKAQPVLPDVPSPTDVAKIRVSPVPEPANRTYQIPPTNLRKIKVSPALEPANRPYNPPPTNLGKIQTNLFKGGRSRRRKTQKKRGRK
jgi:serine/threonine protein kinase